jgi:hypothetical protein
MDPEKSKTPLAMRGPAHLDLPNRGWRETPKRATPLTNAYDDAVSHDLRSSGVIVGTCFLSPWAPKAPQMMPVPAMRAPVRQRVEGSMIYFHVEEETD